jgi:hypothetical protein
LRLRQASEQYVTSAQFLAQRRRQLIARPQAAQGLLGRAALLPRKPAWCNAIVEAREPAGGAPMTAMRRGFWIDMPSMILIYEFI